MHVSIYEYEEEYMHVAKGSFRNPFNNHQIGSRRSRNELIEHIHVIL